MDRMARSLLCTMQFFSFIRQSDCCYIVSTFNSRFGFVGTSFILYK